MSKISPARTYDDNDVYSEADTPVPMSMLHVSIRTVIHMPLVVSSNGKATIGQMVDEHLANCAMAGDMVEGFELEILPQDWQTIAEIAKRNRA